MALYNELRQACNSQPFSFQAAFTKFPPHSYWNFGISEDVFFMWLVQFRWNLFLWSPYHNFSSFRFVLRSTSAPSSSRNFIMLSWTCCAKIWVGFVGASIHFIGRESCLITRSFNDRLIDWLIDWSIGRLVDWILDGLIDWLIDWLIEFWIDQSIDWLIDWLVDWILDWSIDRLIDWLDQTRLCIVDWSVISKLAPTADKA